MRGGTSPAHVLHGAFIEYELTDKEDFSNSWALESRQDVARVDFRMFQEEQFVLS